MGQHHSLLHCRSPQGHATSTGHLSPAPAFQKATPPLPPWPPSGPPSVDGPVVSVESVCGKHLCWPLLRAPGPCPLLQAKAPSSPQAFSSTMWTRCFNTSSQRLGLQSDSFNPCTQDGLQHPRACNTPEPRARTLCSPLTTTPVHASGPLLSQEASPTP